MGGFYGSYGLKVCFFYGHRLIFFSYVVQRNFDLVSWWKQIVLKRISMGLTNRRKTAKNLVDSRKNWKILTVSRK